MRRIPVVCVPLKARVPKIGDLGSRKYRNKAIFTKTPSLFVKLVWTGKKPFTYGGENGILNTKVAIMKLRFI